MYGYDAVLSDGVLFILIFVFIFLWAIFEKLFKLLGVRYRYEVEISNNTTILVPYKKKSRRSKGNKRFFTYKRAKKYALSLYESDPRTILFTDRIKNESKRRNYHVIPAEVLEMRKTVSEKIVESFEQYLSEKDGK